MSVIVQQTLISARFLATFGHFIALLILFMTINGNINAGLPDNYTQGDWNKALTESWVSLLFI